MSPLVGYTGTHLTCMTCITAEIGMCDTDLEEEQCTVINVHKAYVLLLLLLLLFVLHVQHCMHMN